MKWVLGAIVVAMLALFVYNTREQRYALIPAPLWGEWIAEDSGVVSASIQEQIISFVHEDRRISRCEVIGVGIYTTGYLSMQLRKITRVYCEKPDPQNLADLNKLFGTSHDSRDASWSLYLVQDDSELYNAIEVREEILPFNDNSHFMGQFFKQ